MKRHTYHKRAGWHFAQYTCGKSGLDKVSTMGQTEGAMASNGKEATMKLFEMKIPVKVVAATEAEAREKVKAMAGEVWKSTLGGEILFEAIDDDTPVTADSRF